MWLINWYAPAEISEITKSIDLAKSYGDIWIDTVVNIGAYWVGQKVITPFYFAAFYICLFGNWVLYGNHIWLVVWEESVEFTERLGLAVLREELNRHNYLYYVLDQPEITDAKYDQLYRKLVAIEGEYPELVTAPAVSPRGSPPGA